MCSVADNFHLLLSSMNAADISKHYSRQNLYSSSVFTIFSPKPGSSYQGLCDNFREGYFLQQSCDKQTCFYCLSALIDFATVAC